MREIPQVNRYRGILSRLARDKTGTTLAMMAAAMIPTIVIAGSAIDVTRMYVTKTRLQQACDAGVLAGRKFMLDSNASTLDANAQDQARKFFGNNFKTGWMGTTSVSFNPTKTADHQVAGAASTTLPMTLMASFGQANKVITTQCEARFDVADADIMFVLDTTGSMSCTPADNSSCSGASVSYTRASDGSTGFYSTEKSGSKMQATRDAVLAFYDTMVANADPSTHIRYGFVPYNAQVNVGYLLPQSALVSQWHYQTRRAVGDVNSGSPTVITRTGWTSEACNAANNTRSLPASSNDYKFDTTNTAYTYTFNNWTSASGGTCQLNQQKVTPRWRYGQWDIDTSSYRTGASVQDPSMFAVSMNRWRGCVEERDTTASTSFNGTLPYDLDPDTPATNTATQWRPVWPEVMWFRNQNGPSTSGSASVNPNPYSDSTAQNGISGTFDSYNDEVTCMKRASRIATMTRAQISSFVNDEDFRPAGSTYHDIGMIWGLRLISPNGLFSGDTQAWPGRNAPNRHIIFMTDGFMAPTTQVYSAYGVEQLDRRVTGNSIGNQLSNHNARFKAVCAAAKAKNITVWMIAFGRGGGLTPEMNACASPGKAYYVDTATQLSDKFKEIATQIAQLRLSK